MLVQSSLRFRNPCNAVGPNGPQPPARRPVALSPSPDRGTPTASSSISPPPSSTATASCPASVAAIVGGILVFHDPIGSGARGITARLPAFGLVITGAALIPGPIRAADPM